LKYILINIPKPNNKYVTGMNEKIEYKVEDSKEGNIIGIIQ